MKAELDKRLASLDAKLDAGLVSPLAHLDVLHREMITRDALDLVAHNIARSRKAELSVRPPRRPRPTRPSVGATIGHAAAAIGHAGAATATRIGRHRRTSSGGNPLDSRASTGVAEVEVRIERGVPGPVAALDVASASPERQAVDDDDA